MIILENLKNKNFHSILEHMGIHVCKDSFFISYFFIFRGHPYYCDFTLFLESLAFLRPSAKFAIWCNGEVKTVFFGTGG